MTLSLVLAATALSAAPPDDFYVTRLRAGEEAYTNQLWAQAADELRVASFGLLENPPTLTRALFYLALSQSRAKRTAELTETLNRFVDVERRFPGYAKLDAPAEAKKEFEGLLAERVLPRTLSLVPSLARLVETDAQKIAKLPAASRVAALEQKAKEEPASTVWTLELSKSYLETGDEKAAIRWASKTLELDEEETEARVVRARAHFARSDWDLALADLKLLPEKTLAETPALQADLFVCLARAKDWTGARESLARVPADLQERPDVAAAKKRLPAEAPAPAGEPSQTAAGVPPSPGPPPAAPPERAAPPRPQTGETAAASTPTTSAPPPAAGGPSPAAMAGVVAEARKLVSEGRADEARKRLLPLARSGSTDRELRRTILEVAYFTKDWSLAAAQVPYLEPFADGEEPQMFYAAVGLFEAGKVEEARSLIRRARPKINPSPFVDYYTKRILGTP